MYFSMCTIHDSSALLRQRLQGLLNPLGALVELILGPRDPLQGFQLTKIELGSGYTL